MLNISDVVELSYIGKSGKPTKTPNYIWKAPRSTEELRFYQWNKDLPFDSEPLCVANLEQISKNQLEGNNNWSRQLWNIFDSKFISTFIALVLIGVIYMGLFVLISNVARFGILAFFIGMVVLFAFVLRFAIVAPAITIGGLSIKEAFQFSLRNISWGRGFKMVFIIFVACIAIFIVMLLITLIFNLIAY